MQITLNVIQPSVPEIDPAEAHKKAREGALFVDVRELEEIRETAFDVPDVFILPLGELTARYDQLSKERELVVVCLGGGRSWSATDFLLKHGYEKVANLRGGILQWREEGFPIKGGAHVSMNINPQ